MNRRRRCFAQELIAFGRARRLALKSTTIAGLCCRLPEQRRHDRIERRGPCRADAMGFAMRLSVRAGFALLAAAAAAAAFGGWALGELLHLNACPLCIFQRLLSLLLMLFALAGVVLPTLRRLWALLAGLTAAGGLATALYQSWLQFAALPSNECGFGEPTLIERLVDWFGMQWPSLFLATGFCSSKELVFLGLSMANWAAFCFAGCVAAAVWLARRRFP
jgi:disulfide bond formation protein DsbB